MCRRNISGLNLTIFEKRNQFFAVLRNIFFLTNRGHLDYGRVGFLRVRYDRPKS